MKKTAFLIIAAVILNLSACNSESVTKNSHKAQQTPQITLNPGNTKVQETLFTKESYPRVDGSTATIPLSEAYASKLLGIPSNDAKSFVKHNTTHPAYENLINDNADIIFVTEPSDEELKLAKDSNIEIEVVPIVKDAFVFLVNSKNPVESLTDKQIRDIYQGKTTNWKSVGGNDKEIIAYQRTKNSGSQTLMENLVMKGLKMASPKKEYVPSEMSILVDKVAGYDNSDKAIGYSVFYYAKTMYSKNTIKLIAVNGIRPEKETIMKGSYPYTSAYYAVFKKSEPEDSNVRKLLKWILGNEGQSISEEAGYVPLGKV